MTKLNAKKDTLGNCDIDSTLFPQTKISLVFRQFKRAKDILTVWSVIK